jgi:hypothetical protein
MVLSVLIIFIIIFIYLKYPQVFSFKTNFVNGRYIRLDREAGSEAINIANFIIYDLDGSIITPNALSVNPNIAFGNGKNPQARTTNDLSDIVLIETTSGTSGSPYIEYDLGTIKKVSKILIINRKKYNTRMQKTVLRILDEDRNQIFEKKITDLNDIYSIDIS